MSSGSFCRSASIFTMISPVEWSIAAMIAAVCPALTRNSIILNSARSLATLRSALKYDIDGKWDRKQNWLRRSQPMRPVGSRQDGGLECPINKASITLLSGATGAEIHCDSSDVAADLILVSARATLANVDFESLISCALYVPSLQRKSVPG